MKRSSLASGKSQASAQEELEKVRELKGLLERRVAEREAALREAKERWMQETEGHRRADEALRESEEKYHAVAQSAADAIITIDSGGKILFWNRAAEDIFGYPTSEIVGKPVDVLMPERYRKGHRKAVERLASGGGQMALGKAMERVGLRKDGGEFLAECSVAMWKAGEGTFFTGILRDITERKQAELKLKKYAEELEEKLKLLEERGMPRSEFLIRPGNSYIIKEKACETSAVVFSGALKSGIAGLCITAINPANITEAHCPEGRCRTIWLSASAAAAPAAFFARDMEVVPPTDFNTLMMRISEFIKKNRESAIHLIGIENLITVNGFERAYNFMKSMMDKIALNNARLLVSVNPEAMDPRELSLLEKSLTAITDDDLERLGIKTKKKTQAAP